MSNTTTNAATATNRTSEYIVAFFKGIGQVMFQNSVWTGILFLAGIFWGAYHEGQGYVAWAAVVGTIVSTATGYILGLPRKDGDIGLWGFNGVLVGCGVMTFLGNTPFTWCAMIFCSALTVWVRKGFNSIMAPWKVNSFTFPFVFCTWIFVICARLFSNMPPEFMGTPELPDNITFTSGTLTFGLIVEYWLKGIAQVFLINSWVTGILFLIGLALCSRWAAFWAAAGSAISLALAIAFGAPMDDYAQGLYGFSGVLTAIALGCTFYKPNVRSAVWAVTGIIATFFIQAAMNVMFTPLGLPSFTAPFCVATWLFLLPQFKLDSDKDEVDNSEWGKKHVK